MSTDSVRFPPFAALTLASAFWGIATVISKALLTSIPPMLFLIVQLVPSVCVLWALVLANNEGRAIRGAVAPVSVAVVVTRFAWRPSSHFDIAGLHATAEARHIEASVASRSGAQQRGGVVNSPEPAFSSRSSP